MKPTFEIQDPCTNYSATENVLAFLNRIEKSRLNAFVALDAEGARAMAHYCDHVASLGASLGALHGLSLGIKDLVDVAGLPTTSGSRQFLDARASEDAPVVRRLRAQGAIVLGKTNTHEFAYGSTGDNSHFGAVRNPHDETRMSGGSSSGSAAAVAAGLCDAALGTDTSASIRIPAALCGVVGMKPTYGTLPKEGVVELSATLDHIGPLTRDVRSNALVLEALTEQPGAFSKKIDRGVKGLRVGRVKRFYEQHLSISIRRAHEECLLGLAAAGAHVVDVDLPEIVEIYTAQQTILRAEAYSTHRRSIEKSHFYSDEVLSRLMSGRDVAAHDYLDCLRYRLSAIRAFDRALGSVDCILTPTCGVTAPLLYERRSYVNEIEFPTFQILTRLTAPTNLSGHPSLSVPFGRDGELPIGLQLIGRWHDEETLYQVASEMERNAVGQADLKQPIG